MALPSVQCLRSWEGLSSQQASVKTASVHFYKFAVCVCLTCINEAHVAKY